MLEVGGGGGGGGNRYNRSRKFLRPRPLSIEAISIWCCFTFRPLLHEFLGCVRLETSSKSTKTDFVASYS